MKILTYCLITVLVSFNFVGASAQLVGSATNTQTPAQEIRKGTTVQYSVPAGAVGEQYSWEIVGGTPTPAASSGAGTSADPYIVNFTPDLTSISVVWNTDAQAIAYIAGLIRVQKRTGGCISTIQSLNISCWSNPTATITDADVEMCSGDGTTGGITVQFTGAPNFDFKYTIKDLDGNIGAEQTVTGVTSGTATIPLPANLVNTSTTVDQTYEVTLTQMNDAFQGDGTIADGSFKITVHPGISTGTITVSPASLQRR